jgi:hypothetical protein
MTKNVIITKSAQNFHGITDHKDKPKITDISLFCSENSGFYSIR